MTVRPLSLAALTVLELAPPDMVRCAAAAGYSHVGLRVIPATPTEVSYATIGDTPVIRDVLRRLSDTGVHVSDIEILRLTPDVDVRAFAAVLETAARLGAPNALVAGNDPDFSRLTANFAALCDLGAPLGIAMNIEPMPWTDVKNLQQGARLVADADKANAGVLIDALHFDRSGNVPADIAAVPQTRLRYMQLCDAPGERPQDVETLLYHARAARLMPGDGELDLAGILRALPRDLPVSLEIPMQELARTVPAVERAKQMRAKALALLATLD